MKIKVETVEVRHTKAHNERKHSGLHSRAGFIDGRIVEVTFNGTLHVGIVYPFGVSVLEDFARDVGPEED